MACGGGGDGGDNGGSGGPGDQRAARTEQRPRCQQCNTRRPARLRHCGRPPVTALSAAARGVGGKVRQRFRTNADLRRGGGRATLTAVAPSGERGASCYLMTAAKWGGGRAGRGSWIRARGSGAGGDGAEEQTHLDGPGVDLVPPRPRDQRGRDRKPCSSPSRRRAAHPSTGALRVIWGLTSAAVTPRRGVARVDHRFLRL